MNENVLTYIQVLFTGQISSQRIHYDIINQIFVLIVQELVYILKHQTVELTPHYLFSVDQLQEKDKMREFPQLIFLYTQPPLFHIEEGG